MLRRLGRPMQVQRQETLTDHLALLRALLRESPEEAHAPFADLLIAVTSFCRAPEAWERSRPHRAPEDAAPEDGAPMRLSAPR